MSLYILVDDMTNSVRLKFYSGPYIKKAKNIPLMGDTESLYVCGKKH